MSDPCTVYVIDDDEGVRNSLCLTLQTAGMVTRGYESAEAFLQDASAEMAGCIILDFRLGAMSGLELLRQLRDRQINLPAIMITGHGNVPAAVTSMKLGAVDFLEKPIDPDLLVRTMRSTCSQYEQRRAHEQIQKQANQRFKDLTPREFEILRLLAAGRSSKQIANDLNISMNTVENHRAHLLNKAGADNIAQLIHLAGIAQRV